VAYIRLHPTHVETTKNNTQSADEFVHPNIALRQRRLHRRPTLQLNSFSLGLKFSADEVIKLISQAPNKTSQLDPVPTWVVTEFSNPLVPLITLLFSKALDSGQYPKSFKHAVVYTAAVKQGKHGSDAVEQLQTSQNDALLS